MHLTFSGHIIQAKPPDKGLYPCADPESVVRGDPTLRTFFFVLGEIGSIFHHRPAGFANVSMLKRRFADGPMMAQH